MTVSATLTWVIVGVMSYQAPALVSPRDCGKSISGQVMYQGEYRQASARISCRR